MKILRHFMVPLASFFTVCTLHADIVLVGEGLNRSPEIAQRLRDAKLASQAGTPASLSVLDAAKTRVVVLAEEKPLPPESRAVLSRFLAQGGHLVVVGAHSFDYAPRPTRAVPLVAAPSATSHRIVTPERKAGSRKQSNPEPARHEALTSPDGQPAVGFRTYLRGMGDFLVEFDAAAARSRDRSVLTFWAKGDAYMDLLALEIRDTRGQRWLGFVPLAAEWKRHAISLADFMPDGWAAPDEPYPLLEPATVATVGLGTNMLTLWPERPMTLAVGSVALAENETGIFAPTSALLHVRLPFFENGIKTPAWLFDPFAGAAPVAAATLRRAGAATSIKSSGDTWLCPPPNMEHPGPRMGTDHRKDYILKFERETRRETLWAAVATDGTSLGPVAELRVAAAGAHKGANIALFSAPFSVVRKNPALLETLAATIVAVATQPKVAGATINTTAAKTGSQDVTPTVRVVLQNPLFREVKGKLVAKVGDGRVHGEMPVTIPARGTIDASIPLSAVPTDFPFARFDWKIAFESDAGRDELRDSVDVERGLIYALRHLEGTQRQFPDGRISHHYFGDAYGVRALFAYLDLLKREPARFRRNRDLWRTTSPAKLEACGLRFFDMLVARQNEDGAIPMGYSEHLAVYNVADGGQISISLGQVAPLIADPVRRENYIQFCRHFVDWAETFYIDEKLSAQLAAKFPDKVKKGEVTTGHYGLGWGHLKRNETGPFWVMPDILGTQTLLTYVDSNPDYRRIAQRNLRAYLDAGYRADGYFWAEALTWAWLSTDDANDRTRIAASLRDSFVAKLLKGEANDMYDRGSRAHLNGLPLIYYRRFFEDSASVRAVLLKYAWAFASENAPNAMRRISETFPKPAHGESIAAAKQAATGALWAIELLEPGASFLRVEGFPRVPPKKSN